MRWPEWTEKFRHCCGCCEGPHNEHYDAWLARERLAQVKRLETKLADLSKDNAVLSAQLGQAVTVLDSYHSFDLDAVAAQDPAAVGLRMEQRSDSSRRNPSRANSQDGSQHRHSQDASSITSSGRLQSANRISRQALMAGMPSSQRSGGSGRLSSLQAQPMASGGSGRLAAIPAASARLGSLQARPVAPRLARPSVRRFPEDPNASGPAAPASGSRSSRRLGEIPSSQEIEDLLARKSGRKQSLAKQGPTGISPVLGRRVPSPPASPLPGPDEMVERAESVHLPAVGSLSTLARPAVLPILHEASESARSSESFEFSPPPSTQAQLPIFAPPAPKIGILAGPTAQPVQDQAAMATQVRGQVYTGHYSPETSPFAQAAARMPQPGAYGRGAGGR